MVIFLCTARRLRFDILVWCSGKLTILFYFLSSYKNRTLTNIFCFKFSNHSRPTLAFMSILLNGALKWLHKSRNETVSTKPKNQSEVTLETVLPPKEKETVPYSSWFINGNGLWKRLIPSRQLHVQRKH